jgi:hypothetical protein
MRKSWMIGRVGNLIIENYRRRVDNLVPKSTKETLPDFWLITRKKITLILTELLCPCFLFFNINFRVVTVGIKALAWVQELNWNLISIKLVQVVHIRQDEMADCSSAWERGQDPELEHKEIERERERERILWRIRPLTYLQHLI